MEYVLHSAQMVTTTIMVFVLNVRLHVTLAHVKHQIVVMNVTLEVLDTYMTAPVLLHVQKVIMPNQLQKLVNNVTVIVRLVMDQTKITVNLVILQDTTCLLHILA